MMHWKQTRQRPREPIVSAGRHCGGRQWRTGGCIACSGRTENEESAFTTETMLETIPMKHA
ncbi:MAG: hypothetical protein SPK71_04405 [Prevotella sp.]|nr:hypothetical protein [Prevotella sp.]